MGNLRQELPAVGSRVTVKMERDLILVPLFFVLKFKG